KTSVILDQVEQRLVAAIALDKTSLQGPKTLLQERCQAVALQITFDSGADSDGKVVARLRSPQSGRQLVVSMGAGAIGGYNAEPLREGQARLSARLNEIFDVTLGTRETYEAPSKPSRKVASLLVDHAIHFVRAHSARATLARVEPRGLGFLGSQMLLS